MTARPNLPARPEVASATAALLSRGGPLALTLILGGILLAITALMSLPFLKGYDLALTEMLISVVVVVGIYIFVGNSGLLSFGHIGFMAIGAYAAAWATTMPTYKQIMLPALPAILQDVAYPFWASILFAGLLAAAVALVIGVAIMRLSGASSTIATFAFLMIVNSVYSNWDTLTAGTSSVVGIPTVVGPWSALAFAVLAIACAAFYQQSRAGLMLRASRGEPVAARAIGVRISRLRLGAFVLSAFWAGVGGAGFAHFLGFLSPDSLYLNMTFITLAMLVIGGTGSLSGAVVGVIVVTATVEILRLAEQGVALGDFRLALPAGGQELGLAVMMALVLVRRPGGLMQGREILAGRDEP